MKRALYFLTREIPRMQYAPHRVTAFSSQVIMTGIVIPRPCEFHSPLEKLFDPFRAFHYDKSDNFLFTETGPGGDGIIDMIFKAVRFVINRCYPALSQIRV